MKLFQSMLKYYQICGINQPQPNIRTVVIVLFIFLCFISIVETLLFESTTLTEYIDSFCLVIMIIASSVHLFECIWKRTKMLRYIEQWEELIEKSKLKFQEKIWILLVYLSYIVTTKICRGLSSGYTNKIQHSFFKPIISF